MNKNLDSQWLTYNDPNSSMSGEFKIRPIDNDDYQNAIKELDSTAGNIDDIEYGKQLANIVGSHLISDWSGIDFHKDGTIHPTPYTPQNAADLLLLGNLGVEIFRWVVSSSMGIAANSQVHGGEV